ncbi:hypothetical protein AVEN_121410-1 [Araneus ventricosus]|uniref:HAT C-terminal dimerisation domain-containing protein n=1 Tax=Araneus ventricosus TaxID=182803 RepID=A0A4Y2K5R6_ARAVE|nr:hypothetical protein AVEN_121410-1 [Araneus ventricosus]
MCEKHEMPIRILRENKRQVDWSYVDITDPESYYRIAIFLLFMDSMVKKIQNRFLIHKHILSSFPCMVSGSGNIKDFIIFVKFYEDDFLENGAFITNEQAHAEYLPSKGQISGFLDTKSSVIRMLNRCEKEMFLNIYELLRIVALIPETTATPERSYSTLKRFNLFII